MKRALMVFLVAFVAFTSLSHATVTRTKTMGRVDNWVYDDGNIFSWPSTIVGFTDRFYLEVGEDDVQNATYDPQVGNSWPNGFGGGALFGVNEYNHFGFFANGNDRANNGGDTDDFFPDELNLDDAIMLMYGYGAENVDVGVSFDLAKSRNEQTAPEANQFKDSVGRIGIQGGITYWMEDDNSLDVAFEFTKTSITDEAWNAGNNAVEMIAEDDGFSSIAARARLFWNYTDDTQFVPFFEFEKDNRGVKRDSDADNEMETDKTETTTIDLALGINHFPTEQLQLVFVGGVLLSSMDVTTQGEATGESDSKQIPYVKGGIDAELRDWLDIRAGVEKQIFKNSQKGAGDNASETEQAGAAYQGYVGAGIHLGDWTIDTQINPNLFFEGPNFISGTTENLNTRVSLVRPW